MASFQAKVGWKSPRKGENKNFRFILFLPVAQQKIPKNSKKIQKIPLWRLFKPKLIGEGREREKIKIVVLFRSYPTRNRKFQ